MTSFISMDDLSAYIHFELEADDSLGIIAIDSACNMVRAYCNQDFDIATDDTITLDGTGTDMLLLPQMPVTAVSLVTESRTDGTQLQTLVENIDYRVVLDGGFLIRILSSALNTGFYRWLPGRRNVTVTYDHGYVDFPSDLRLVALAVAARIYDHAGVSQETIGRGYSVTYEAAGIELTAGEKAVLSKYKSFRAGL